MLERLCSLIRGLLHRERVEHAMADEMRFHLEAYADDLVAGGRSRDEATRHARVEFGRVERAKEECRQALGFRIVDELRQDARYVGLFALLLAAVGLYGVRGDA